jgi:DNA-binding transcriptional ArsR family regulator
MVLAVVKWLVRAGKWIHLPVMDTPSTPSATVPPVPAIVPTVTPTGRPPAPAMSKVRPRRTAVDVCRALGSGVRMRALRRLLEVGLPMSVSQLASRERLGSDAMSRQLQILEKAGVLVSHPGVDRRSVCYFVPQEFQQEAGWLDLGVVKVRREEI